MVTSTTAWEKGFSKVRDGFKERGALGHLSFGAPRKCDLFGRLSEKHKSMTLSWVVPFQKSIFCGSDIGSTIALDLQHKLKTFLRSFQKQKAMRSFLGIYYAFAKFRSSLH